MILLNAHHYGIGKPNAIPSGISQIRELLPPGSFIEFDPPDPESWSSKQGVKALDSIERHGRRILDHLRNSPPEKICNLGCDCGGELAIIAFLNQRAQGRLQVVWFDAHADLNTSASSPSGNFHGMVLRTLCGEGPQQLAPIVSIPLDPSRIAYVGLRSIDPDEQRFIATHRIPIARSAANLPLHPADPLYIHVDYDVLDGARYPDAHYPTPDGLTLDDLLESLEFLRMKFQVAGASLTEYSPHASGDPLTLRAVLQALLKL